MAAACLATPLFGQQSQTTKALLKDVTVYNATAEMNHQATVKLPKGTSEVVFTHVSNAVDAQSIQVGSTRGVQVLSARTLVSNAVENIKSKDYLAQEAIYKKEVAALTELKNKKETEESVLALLESNQKINLSSATAAAAELEKMATFYRTKYMETKRAISSLTEAIAEQEIKVNQNKTILDGLADQNTASGGQLIVQVMNNQAGEYPFEISYATRAASWDASYDLRADDLKSPLNITYKANIQQHTGVNWDNVNLTLATGNPAQFGSIRELQPWQLYMMDNAPARLYKSAQGAPLSRNALSNDVVEEVASADFAISENQLNTTFKIDIPYTIASNGLAHSVTLQDYSHPAVYAYRAVPKLDQQVYLAAELTDYEKLNLAPGSANIIFENMLVGKTYVNPEASTDTLKLSMGRDRMIVVKREKLNDLSQTKTFGSSTKQDLVYEISLRNNKKSEVTVELEDQYPLSTDKNMEIVLEESSGAQVDKERGILRWAVKLAPGELKKVRFGYSVKYPKGKIVNLN